MPQSNKSQLALTKPSLSLGSRPDHLAPNLGYRRRAGKRSFLDARREDSVIEHLITLPQPGETLHIVIDGRFRPCDIIPAMRRLSDPAVIKRLDVATLGFNRENVETIARGMDQGKIQKATLICSVYFTSHEGPSYEFLRAEITARGGRVAKGLTHAKVILLEMTDGNCYTVEGSANLRSCSSIEQMAITNDRGLLDFHRAWMEDFLGRKEAQT
jgi:hypothetical protein